MVGTVETFDAIGAVETFDMANVFDAVEMLRTSGVVETVQTLYVAVGVGRVGWVDAKGHTHARAIWRASPIFACVLSMLVGVVPQR